MEIHKSFQYKGLKVRYSKKGYPPYMKLGGRPYACKMDCGVEFYFQSVAEAKDIIDKLTRRGQ